MTSPLSAVAIDDAGCVVSVKKMPAGTCSAEIAWFAHRWRATGHRVTWLPFTPEVGVAVTEPLREEVAR